MVAQQMSCILYVDYDGLLAELLHRRRVSQIEQWVLAQVEYVKRKYTIHKIVVLGNWMLQRQRPQFQHADVVWQTVSTSEYPFSRQLLQNMTEDIGLYPHIGAYVLLSGSLEDVSFFQVIQQADKHALWLTLARPPLEMPKEYLSWRTLGAPDEEKATFWPRQVMLQAITLVAECQRVEGQQLLALTAIQEALERIPPFQDAVEAWLVVAIRERLFLLQWGEPSALGCYVPREHALVRRGRYACERVLHTLYALSRDRQWVPFALLEKALQSVPALASTQHLRQAWIELLVALGAIRATKRTQTNASFPMTVVQLETAHVLTAAMQAQQEYELMRLVILADGYLERQGRRFIAATTLLRLLGRRRSYEETRAIYEHALNEHILSPTAPGLASQGSFLVLAHEHEQTRIWLARRNALIALIQALLVERPVGVDAQILLDTFVTHGGVTGDEARYWVDVLCQDGVLLSQQVPLPDGRLVEIFTLEEYDPVVDHVLSQRRQQPHEVE